MNRYALFFVFLASSCAVGIPEEEPETMLVSETLPVPMNLDSDFNNCGFAEFACDADDTDECADGRCQCGLLKGDDAGEISVGDCGDNDAECMFRIGSCKNGFDCKFGRCVPTDARGTVCEFDHECGEGSGCVEGRCANLGCVAEQGTLACDAIDNDCDKCVDGAVNADGFCVYASNTAYDVVFFVDVSGSMARDMPAVLDALSAVSDRFSGDGYRFAIVLVPDYELDGRPSVYSDFADFETFREMAANLHSALQGDEPMYDAVYEIASDELPLSWRAGSNRIMIGLTDEEGQSYRQNFGLSPVSQETMCASLTHGESLMFVAPVEYGSDYNACAGVLSFGQSAEILARGLDGFIRDPCE